MTEFWLNSRSPKVYEGLPGEEAVNISSGQGGDHVRRLKRDYMKVLRRYAVRFEDAVHEVVRVCSWKGGYGFSL